MLHHALRYIRFWLRSGNAHGLHSPFVFGLYTDVVLHTGSFAAFEPVEQRRQALLNDRRRLRITDFGAGSQTGAGTEREVRAIARSAAKPPRLAQLLFRLVNRFRPATILELGTSLGLTTAYLAAASSKARVFTLEGCPQTAAVARETLQQLGIGNVQLTEGNFDHTLPQVLRQLPGPLDFAFFDGNHRYEPTVRYFEQCLPYRTDASVFIFDDIHWSAEMEQAWAAIKAHPEVTLTVDLFFIGLVFFRKSQPKQHFTLRIEARGLGV
ncbi:class I SAM-dependent methyltransferase [Hymenobacter busanensis]|uniref:Class I SAM-dependent methyltransferase n=1 Tax=Hymenobacter busanensis TaxID=2607656 RepID=A0A7L5A2F1_9BACT|nr:class I SAM-dependent methyltransferase [Hymenobacter busanensis]KAA9338223.1 class I SAM-dependent methyltransferase [Hymenobacter busanensis]QHJ09353.1 SAM-dependent methyltransferase [Hymenobacter busanensis]